MSDPSVASPHTLTPALPAGAAVKRSLAAALLAAFVFVVVSRGVVNRIGVQIGLRDGASGYDMVVWPFLALSVLLAPFGLSRHRPQGRAFAVSAGKGAISVGACQVLFVFSQQWGSATFASIASATVPVVAALLVWRQEHVSLRMVAGGALAFTGAVAFALTKSPGSMGSQPLLAIGAASVAVLTASWFYIHNRSTGTAPTLTVTLARLWPQFASSAIVLTVVGSLSGALSSPVSLLPLHVLVGVVGYAAPLVVSVWMLPRAGVALATYTNYAAIPVTALASVLVLNAHIPFRAWAALVLVLAGLWVSLTRR